MPVWDAFLTERDKQHLAASTRGERPYRPLGRRPAVLVIDDYYSVLGTEREDILESVKKWPGSTGLEGWEAIDKTRLLLDAARANNVPVVYCHGLDDFPLHWGNRQRSGGTQLSPEQKAIANKIVEDIAPGPNDLVIEKAAASIFNGTPLVGYLIGNRIDTLIVCGETTSGCVRASVIDGCTLRYRVGVVEDCTFDRTQLSHAANLFDMDQKYAKVMSLDETLAYLNAVGEGLSEDYPI